MRAYTESIPVDSSEVSKLFVLTVEPDIVERDNVSVLLFLHGMGEAGSSLGELPLVAVHQTPPFLALLGCFPETVVVAPQAPPIPSKDDWNWRDYVIGLADFLAERYAGRRIAATGFSRGGLGVLQLGSARPGLIQRWAAVDPQPTRDEEETSFILRSSAFRACGWLRYGLYRYRQGWENFSARLLTELPAENRDTAELSHVEMAIEAYRGSSLSPQPHKKNLYGFLEVKFGGGELDPSS
jgi:pimeloyl-ACP methyl ester carboxylesterase